jgi:hypothetical protein
MSTFTEEQDLECTTCAYANEHGWWGTDHQGTHCRVCHRSWRGLKEIHCVVCHEHFSTPNNLDLHKDGSKCIPPQDVRNQKGESLMKSREGAHGQTWVGAGEWPESLGSVSQIDGEGEGA